ncbi:MAG: hypothetical protein WCI18_17235, partial [Pseudomonadota bacterium]
QTIATRFADANKASGLPAPILFSNDLSVGAMPAAEVVSASNPINVSNYTINTANETPVVSPYSSQKALLFQPILPDHALDFTLEADSVSYFLVTGIVSETTDITAYIGPGTWVTAVPIGQRDIQKRAIFQEKLGQDAYLDLRPVNLTDKSAAPLGANARYTWELSQRVAASDQLDYYTVTKDKELWISGSVANTEINLEGSSTKIGDSDAYVVKIDPCGGPCPADGDYSVIVQTYTRPGSKNFVPMTIVGPVNKTAYHGAMAWGDLRDVDPKYIAPDDGTTHYPWLCQSGQLYSGSVTEAAFCDNGGYNRRLNVATGGTNATITGTTPNTPTGSPRKTGTNFYTKVCNASESNQVLEDACWNGAYDSPAMFDSRNRMDFSLSNSAAAPDLTNYGYGIMGDNFLMSAYGYPYDTTGTIRFEKEITPPGPRPFTKEEANRMFYNFVLNKDLEPHVFDFYAGRSGFSVDDTNGAPASLVVGKDWVLLSDAQITTLSEALRIIADSSPTLTKPLAADDPFVTSCMGDFELAAPVCQSAGKASDTSLFSALQNKIAEKKLYGICREANHTNCDIYNFFTSAFTSDSHAAQGKLFPDEAKMVRILSAETNSPSFYTYYLPTRMKTADSTECHGNAIDDDTGAGWNAVHSGFTTELEERRSNRLYPVKACRAYDHAHDKLTGLDIREQFWLPEKFVWSHTNGHCPRFPDQAQLCFDGYSDAGASEQDALGLVQAPDLQCDVSSTDRLRDARGVINFTKGEVSAMPRRVSANQFSVKGVAGAKNSTYATIIVGGTEKTEGDYLIRIRTFKNRSCETVPNGVRN